MDPPGRVRLRIARGRRTESPRGYSLPQRHELAQERTRLRRVEPVVDVRREALDVAGDRDAHLDWRLSSTGAEELRAARVTAAGAAVAGDLRLREAQPNVVQRPELPDRVPPLHRERVRDPTGPRFRLLGPVADRRKQLVLERAVRLHLVEQPRLR